MSTHDAKEVSHGQDAPAPDKQSEHKSNMVRLQLPSGPQDIYLEKHTILDTGMIKSFNEADGEVAQAVELARQHGIPWKTILSIVIPLVKDPAIEALKKLVEQLQNSGTTAKPS